jgi:hypothetical protein
MKKTDWKSIAELIGIAAIVASLIFVGIQVRQERQIAAAANAQSTSAARAELDFAFAEHAEILVKSNAGIELSETEHEILSTLVGASWRMTIIDYIENRRLGIDDPRFFTDFYAVFLYTNPGARAIWENESEESIRYMSQLNPNSVGLRPIKARVVENLELLDKLNQTE